jgi:hypothetical protein
MILKGLTVPFIMTKNCMEEFMVERGLELTIIVVNHTSLDEDSPGSFPGIGCFPMVSGIRANPEETRFRFTQESKDCRLK